MYWREVMYLMPGAHVLVGPITSPKILLDLLSIMVFMVLISD